MFRNIIAPIVMSLLWILFSIGIWLLLSYGLGQVKLAERFEQNGIDTLGIITNINEIYSPSSGGRGGMGNYHWRCSVEYMVADKTYIAFNVDGVSCEPGSFFSRAYDGKPVWIIYLFDMPELVTASPYLTNAGAYPIFLACGLLAMYFLSLLPKIYNLWMIRICNRMYNFRLEQLIFNDDVEGIMSLLKSVSPRLCPIDIGSTAAKYICDKPTSIQEQFIDWYSPICLGFYKKSKDVIGLRIKMAFYFGSNPSFYLEFLEEVQSLIPKKQLAEMLIYSHVHFIETEFEKSVISKEIAFYKLDNIYKCSEIKLGTKMVEIDDHMKIKFIYELLLICQRQPVEWLEWMSKSLSIEPISYGIDKKSLSRRKRRELDILWEYNLENLDLNFFQSAVSSRLLEIRSKVVEQFEDILREQGVSLVARGK